MHGETITRKIVVQDPVGLHLRPLAKFAHRAGQFECTVTVTKEGQRVNGKSPLDLLLLAADQGTELLLEVTGPDAAQAVDVLAGLLEASGSDEQDAAGLPPGS